MGAPLALLLVAILPGLSSALAPEVGPMSARVVRAWDQFRGGERRPPSLVDAVLDAVESRGVFSLSVGADRPALEEAAATAALRAVGDRYTELLPSDGAGALPGMIARGSSSPSPPSQIRGPAPATLGLTLVKDSRAPGRLTVVAYEPGGAGEAAGLRIGDRVVGAAGNPVDTSAPLGDIAADILSGGSVTVERPGAGAPFELGPVRAAAPKVRPSVALAVAVSSQALSSGGSPKVSVYIKIDSFGPRAGAEVLAALADALDQTAPAPTTAIGATAPAPSDQGIAGVVLDLRNNPGGRLDSALEVASLFLDEGAPVVTLFTRDAPRAGAPRAGAPRGDPAPGAGQQSGATRRPSKLERVELSADGGALVPTAPLVVLVDSGSRSAAEVVAAALQENDRGVIVGNEPTFGKATAQEIIDLQVQSAPGNGNGGGGRGGVRGGGGLATRQLRVTTAVFETPAGRRLDQSAALASAGETGEPSGERSRGASSYRSLTRGRPLPAPRPGLAPDVAPPPPKTTDPGLARRPALGGGGGSVGGVEQGSSFGGADGLLVRSGAYFDFADEWCARRPQLVQRFQQSVSGPSPAEATAASARPSPSRAAAVEALEEALERGGPARGGPPEAGLYGEFRAWLVAGPGDRAGGSVWGRSGGLEALAAAERAVEADPVIGEAAKEAARRQLRAAGAKVEAELLASMDRERPAVETRARDAIRARFLAAEELKAQRFRHDDVVEFALSLFGKENKDIYDRALRPPAGDTAGAQFGRRGAPNSPATDATTDASTGASTGASGARRVRGFEASGQCLPLQVCDQSEYVYVTQI